MDRLTGLGQKLVGLQEASMDFLQRAHSILWEAYTKVTFSCSCHVSVIGHWVAWSGMCILLNSYLPNLNKTIS